MNERSVVQLQQEAAERVQRMAERSRRLVREHPVNVYRGVTFVSPTPAYEVADEPPACECNACEQAACEAPPVCEHPKQNPRSKDLVSFLAGDSERVLLLLLILMLSHNDAPAELLLALLYVAF